MNSSISSKNKKSVRGHLYTNLKIFHFKKKIDSLPKENRAILPPLHIRIKPTNVCNHNCYYCAYRTDNLQLGKDMKLKDYIPKEKIFEIIEDLQDMGVKAVTFSGGGEPFCYPFLLDAAKKLAKTKIKFAALTNGSLLTGEIAAVFSHHAKWIRISIDGWDNKSYSAYRKAPHSEFTKIISNIIEFKKYKGRCYLGVCIIINKNNALHIYELTKKLKNSGVDSVKIAPCIVSNSVSQNNKFHSPIFRIVKKQIAQTISRLADKEFEIFDSYHGQLESFKKEYTWCPYLQILPVIGADQNIYPCQDKAYNLDEGLIGSIKHMRFKDFWFSNKNNFFKINPSLHCNHHCVANTKNKLILDYLNADKNHLEFV